MTDKPVSFYGKVAIVFDGREIVFDVSGLSYARTLGEAAWNVTTDLQDRILLETRHDATSMEPGWPDEY